MGTNLDAANNYKVEHLQQPEHLKLVEDAKVIYSAGFFITVCPDAMRLASKEAAKSGKTYCLNLSAPFIMQVPPFKAALDDLMQYCDFVFGNESEAATYGEVSELAGYSIEQVALKIAALPKASGTRPRVVVFTQGKDPTLVACGGVITKYDVPPLAKEDLVDSNGAGDAFVGGFLAYLCKGGDIQDCVSAGNWAARQIIQQSGCKIPSGTCKYMASL